MPRSRRILSEQEKSVWTEYAQQVLPLSGRLDQKAITATGNEVARVIPAHPLPSSKTAVTRPATNSRVDAILEIGRSPGGVDKASWRRLRTGQLRPSRTLDLHGQTAQHAFDTLFGFLYTAHGDGVRCVEIITGRGAVTGSGVIRREMPHWLNQPSLRSMVLGAAHPHVANPGSVRLLLRRNR